ncbi:DUF262 domain-containing protein [Martelella alba]|uniref:DUF262 domain-containing protein n=1 Tax=Martelella alba TaxID=2590451 RepID=A0A506U027_9HYPH|nr:DUF262 domain-containing protein [Martelella alba]TPW26344.1 DUF262 domain-containing protein [Martelella alba]
MPNIQQELVVRGEQVERMYLAYIGGKYLVNRRYQRKLIWTLNEKQKFIDSIVNGFPIPIILLAEPKDGSTGTLEIIDGMQRMNAIMSFIGNEYPIDGGYFDLNTFATTKDLMDRSVIDQMNPILPRDQCLAIASYPVPLSIYEFAENESIDEVFRRINSGGRQLSRQELRAAGATNAFADCVRLISSSVRGDVSNSDTLLLNAMKEISIANRELHYGIVADDVFWVSNNILTKDQLRQSRDEELVADLIAYMLSEAPVASRTELFDDYFGASFPLEGAKKDRFEAMDIAVRRRTSELLEHDFQRILDAIILCINASGVTFSQWLFSDNNQGNVVPRYFQSVFLAFHNLIVSKGMAVSDRTGLVGKLCDMGKMIPIQEGGRWGADARAASVDSVIGMIQNYFEDDAAPDPAKVQWVTKLNNLLMSSKTEQSAYDFKQGFMTLAAVPSFDEGAFDKILETCVAIANIGPGHKGYVVVGVADKPATAVRVEELFGVKPFAQGGFYVTGVEHEAAKMGKNLDQLFQDITDRISRSGISEPLKSFVNSRLKSASYFDKSVFVFEVVGQDQPSMYCDKYYQRQGTQVFEVEPKGYPALFGRFR